MNNANMTPGARIPRNALRVWQSDKTIATLTGHQLTVSLRTCLSEGATAVHPCDWPRLSSYQTSGVIKYLAAFEQLTPSQQAMVESWQV